MSYRLLLVLKFMGVLTYAGGLTAAFLSDAPLTRRRAVHQIAAGGLLVTWLTGYALVTQSGQHPGGLGELWVSGGLGLSLVSYLALIHSVTHGSRTPLVFACAAGPLLLVVTLMVFRPTWTLLGR
jgi:hypothetical protein